MNNNSNVRYKESRVERDNQTQEQGYVSRFEPLALHLRLHLEGYQLSPLSTPQRIQTQSSTQEEAQSQDIKPTISIQEMGTKPKHKAMKIVYNT